MKKEQNDAYELLHKYKQDHIINHIEKQTEQKKDKLIAQVLDIDFELISSLYKSAEKELLQTDDEITPMDYMDRNKLNGGYSYYKRLGEKSIRNRELAVVTLARRQGTRLGFDGPKGAFDIGLDSHKSLFELLADNIKEANNLYDVKIPWFIMTSNENDKQTKEFFKKHHYFGFRPNIDLFFFVQGRLPMVNTEGKILINEEGYIKLASDGHGGVYKALVKNNVIPKMRSMGIKWIFIGGVDNCLAKLADPLFIGIAKDRNVTVACKSVLKNNPHEKVGVFCKRNGKPSVIEYSEITKQMAEEKDENGELLYGESNLLCNLFDIDSVERMGSIELNYHVAFKKANYIDENGNIVIANSPNAYKFESFLFDSFGTLDEMLVLRVNREDEFAPVKNKDDVGVDCPATARKLYESYMQRKLENR